MLLGFTVGFYGFLRRFIYVGILWEIHRPKKTIKPLAKHTPKPLYERPFAAAIRRRFPSMKITDWDGDDDGKLPLGWQFGNVHPFGVLGLKILK